ncbi:formin-binding protein, partial [Spiromyces aspiralis]
LVFSKNKDGQTSKSIADPTATDDNDKGQSSASTLEPMSESSKTEISSTCRFANNFWSDDDKGVVVLTRKLQNAKHTMANIHRVMAARAQLEEEYGKKLLKLSRNTLGQEELGTTRDSLHCFRNELESSANTHIKLSKQIRDDLIKPLAAFIEQQRQKRKQLRERKNTETARRIELERLVISMQEMVDPKVRQKLEKAQISSQNSERDYKETLRKLDESEGQWVSAWQSACDVFQVLEEERIDYLKTKLWEYTNLISSICVSDDESMERIRQELENVDVECDIEQFIKTFGTGALSRDATGSSSSNSGSTPVGGDSDVPETPLSNRSATQSSGISKPPDHGTASHTSVSDRESSARKAPLTPQQTPHNSLNGQYPQQPLQSGASPAQARPSSGTPTSHHHHQQQQQSIPARPQDSASGAWQARPGTSMQQHPFTHPPPSQQPQQQQQYRRASGNEMYNHAPQPHYSPNSQPYPVDPRAPSSIGSYHQHPDPRVPSSMGHRPPTVSSMYGTNSSATPPSGAYAGGHPPPDNRSIPRHRSSTFNDPGTVGGSLPPGSGQYASLSSSTGVPPHPA